MNTHPPDYNRINELTRSLLAELGATRDTPDWHARAERAMLDTLSAAAGALATLDRLRGREAPTTRAWKARCAEPLDIGFTLPDAVLGVKNVQGRVCSGCKHPKPLPLFTNSGAASYCASCQQRLYQARVAGAKVWTEIVT